MGLTVVGSVLLATDHELRVEELSILTGADLAERTGIQVNEDTSRDELPTPAFGEESLPGKCE